MDNEFKVGDRVVFKDKDSSIKRGIFIITGFDREKERESGRICVRLKSINRNADMGGWFAFRLEKAKRNPHPLTKIFEI